MFLEQKNLFEKIQNDLMIIQYTSVQKTFCFCKIFQEETNDLLERRIWEDHLTIECDLLGGWLKVLYILKYASKGARTYGHPQEKQ